MNSSPKHIEKFDDDNGEIIAVPTTVKEAPKTSPEIIDLGENIPVASSAPVHIPAEQDPSASDGNRRPAFLQNKLLIFYFVIIVGGLAAAIIVLRNQRRKRNQEILDELFGDTSTCFGEMPEGRSLRSISIADLDLDGNLDVVTASYDSDFKEVHQVIMGNGDGTLRDAVNLTDLDVSFFPGKNLVGDFNVDGYPDILAYSSGRSYLYVNYGDGTFGGPVRLSNLPYGLKVCAIGDLNGDGLPDLACENDIYFNNPSIDFGDYITLPVSDGSKSKATATVIADFTNDGAADVIRGIKDSYIQLSVNNGDGSFQDPINLPVLDVMINTVGGPSYDSDYNVGHIFLDDVHFSVGDFNADGKEDLVVGHEMLTLSFTYKVHLLVYINKGGGKFEEPLLISECDNAKDVAVADMDADGNLDIIVAGLYSPSLVILGNGDGTFKSASEIPCTGSPFNVIAPKVSKIAVGDLDNDGYPDIILGTRSIFDQRNQLLINQGSGVSFEYPDDPWLPE